MEGKVFNDLSIEDDGISTAEGRHSSTLRDETINENGFLQEKENDDDGTNGEEAESAVFTDLTIDESIISPHSCGILTDDLTDRLKRTSTSTEFVTLCPPNILGFINSETLHYLSFHLMSIEPRLKKKRR